jgi:hypothetical protein
MTVAKRRRNSSTDDKVEAKRKIIRKSLDEITVEIEQALRCANLRSAVSIVVPSRYSLVTIGGVRDLPPDEWSLVSAIVRRIVGQRLGGRELRGRPLARAVATAATAAIDVADVPRE